MDNDAATTLVERIDALLPQTQCRRCGYDGCRPYAHAIAQGSATINQCPPGGDDTVAALSKLLGVPLLPLDRASGARDHFAAHVARLERKAAITRSEAAPRASASGDEVAVARRRAAVAAALARARARRAARAASRS